MLVEIGVHGSRNSQNASQAAQDDRSFGEAGLFLYAVCELFDHGVGEDLFGDALDEGFGGFGREAIGEGKCEILALADGGDVGEADFAECVVDGLALGVEDGYL